ncbi:MAG: helix-turn-helix domain-containing protein [Actinomycetota bacterium]|nr:helix-turn-helix domain-containing protein [Actinomycetota bacterium]
MAPPPGDALGNVVYLRSYTDRDRSDHDVVARVLDATTELVRATPYAELTTALIAERAGVGHAELCAYFRSKDAIVAEVYLGLLRAAPLDVDLDQPSRARIIALFDGLVMLLADHPALAAACSAALISRETSVQPIRRRIHTELRRRVRTVLRSGAWPEVAETLEFSLVGAMVQASSGTSSFRAAADELSRVVAAVLPEDS